MSWVIYRLWVVRDTVLIPTCHYLSPSAFFNFLVGPHIDQLIKEDEMELDYYYNDS